MSDNLDFYVQGRIEPGTPFHIVSKRLVTTPTAEPFNVTNFLPNNGDNYWSTLGVKEKYVNFFDIMTDPFYAYDGTNYYYPLYLCDRGGSNAGSNPTRAQGTANVNNGVLTVTVTSPGIGFSEGQTVRITDGTNTGAGTVSVNDELGVVSVNVTDPGTFTNGATINMEGLTSNLFTNTASTLEEITDLGFRLSDGAIIANPTVNYIKVFGNTDTIADSTYTTAPHPDTNYKSWDAIKYNNFFVKEGSIYYYPVFLIDVYGTPSSNYTVTGTTILFDDTNASNSLTSPNGSEADCIFYNPFNSLMDTLFKYSQNEDGTINLQLVSSGHYMESAHQYQYITYSSSGTTPSYTLTASKNEDDSKPFVLSPVGYNVNSSKIYAGVPYILKINENVSSLNYNFIDGIKKETPATYLDRYFKGLYSGSPRTTEFFGDADSIDYSSLVKIEQDFVSSTNPLVLYFIPAKETTYQLSTHKILTYLDYNAVDMLLMSPQIYNARPSILNGSATGYYTWRTTTGQSTSSTELAFSSQMSGAFTGLAYNYCTGTNTCGKCFGKCDLATTVNPTAQCVYDSLSVEKFNAGEDTFTCDHERYYDKSEYVSSSFVTTHSHTALIIVLVVGIIIAAGFILFEERNRISKEFFKLKNGRK